MKTIIACTDFSPDATNAVQYAAALAAATKAKLVLFHYFDYPVAGTDLPQLNPMVIADEMDLQLERKLEGIRAELTRTYPIKIECIVRSFSLHSDLEELFHDEQADLVVMGIEGQNMVLNALANVTTATIRRGKVPVLVVPRGVAFHPLKRILFSCDNHVINNPDTLRILRDLAIVFDAHIQVLNLFELDKMSALVLKDARPSAKNSLETLLTGTRHGYTYKSEEVIDKGILYEAARSSADLVAMVSHRHSFLSTLLNQSATQRIATAISLPLLVLGEKVEQLAEVEQMEEHR
jgi:nucleotide-binding universal stress UspA family protein